MALTWNVERIADHAVITTLLYEDGEPVIWDGEKRWHPVTEALVWRSMACGFNAITEANVMEVFVRVAAWDAVNGSGIRMNGEPYAITLNDVRRHIGLGTNATPLTDKQFREALDKEGAGRRGGPEQEPRVLRD